MNRIKKIFDKIYYHDGVYKLHGDYTYMGHTLPDVFAWNGVTGAPFTTKKMVRPSMIHDYLLSLGRPRKTADKTFYNAMRSENVGIIKAKLYYYIVRTTSILKRD